MNTENKLKIDDFTRALAECIHQAQCSVVDHMAHAEIWKKELLELAKSEEPVSEQNLSNVQRFGKKWKEPVSEDLEEAARNYGDELDNVLSVGIDDDNSVGEYATHAFIAGAQWDKEQMLAKAIDGEVGYWNLRGLSVNVELPRSVNEGDKVKVIVIKEG